MVKFMLEDILSGAVLGAYVHRVSDVPILFIHAGIRPKFADYLKEIAIPDNFTADAIAEYVNGMLKFNAFQCSTPPCKFEGELFDSGPDRGGSGIGGPL